MNSSRARPSKSSHSKSASRRSSPANTKEQAHKKPTKAHLSPPDLDSLEGVDEAAPVRLQKHLANLGFGSRRQIEAWIEDGWVTVDNQVATLGERVLPFQEIRIDGQLVQSNPTDLVELVLYHKPVGELTTRAREGHRTVFDSLPMPQQGRWVAIGRLDLNTTGLLLLTNNGELAHRAMHPSYELSRTYWVRARGMTVGKLAQAVEGVVVDGQHLKLDKADCLQESVDTRHNCYYQVSLQTGRNREVRRVFEALGCEVSRLKRLSYGNIKLPIGLHPGRYSYASAKELQGLMALVGLSGS